MAERRMFSKTVINDDKFLDMPATTRSLYFHLGMMADDDGFIASPKAIIRSSNCSEDDLKLLIAKGFVIGFESGVIVIRHWKMHNYIQKDRYRHTSFKKECEQLVVENGIYQKCIQDVSSMYTECIQDVRETDTQYSIELGKDIDRVRNTSCTEPEVPSAAVQNMKEEPVKETFVIALPLNDKTEYQVSLTKFNEYKELYPAVDISQELRNMRGWLLNNPDRRKTRRGITRFINSWLAKKQDKGKPCDYRNEPHHPDKNSTHQDDDPYAEWR